jgi:hypothetical protein
MKSLSGISFVGFLVILFFLSCSPVTKIAVNNVNDTGSLQTASFIYALPQTIIDIHVTAEEITIIPGPYEKYAEKYLGIQNVPAKTQKIWNIKKLEMRKHAEADADYIYAIRGINDPDNSPWLNRLIKDSMILSAVNFSSNQVYQYFYPAITADLPYTDLSIKRNFEAEKEIEVSRVMPDTNYQTKPDSRNALKEKTLEQKAEEAANFLLKLKKRRFKLVAGQYENMPEGEAMTEALKELSRIEKEYLSLFIGKQIITDIQRNFQFTPATGKETDRVVLFRFSPDEGYIDARETNGIPVMLEYNVLNKTKGLEQYKVPQKPSGNILFYRIADQVAFKLFAGEQIWAEAMYPVFQCGVLVPMRLGR